jgi:murein DD-endopeptidase
MHYKIIIAAFLCLVTTHTHAQTKPQFAFPVDCELGKTCWTVNYVDTDSHPKSARDFTCASKTYEGHKGTDFGLRSRIEMNNGVNVLAARDGKVLRMRDGEDDTPKTEEEYQTIRNQNKDCGNGVIIDHGNGLQSYYCHLKKDSITVAIGDEVKKGDAIAQVGQSGFAEFPHLHFTVIWEGGQIDPFTGNLKDDGCGKVKDNLWEDDLAYEPYAIFDGGFSNSVPDFKAIAQGQIHPKSLSGSGDAFVYWVGFYQAVKNDRITLKIYAPDGQVIAERAETLAKSRKRPSYFYTGRKLKERTLPSGIYTGSITYERKGHPAKTVTHTVMVN